MRSLLTLLTLLLISASAAAQEATPASAPDGWEVVQRCITAPSEPPDGWTFEGTIFTYRGSVHGFRADLPSPYYIAYGSDTEFGGAGTFSPDGRWYALPRGRTSRTDTTFSTQHVVDTLRIVSTAPDRIIYDIPWRLWDSHSEVWFMYRPRWLDNRSLEYATDQQVTIMSSQIPFRVNDNSITLKQVLISSSPDSTRSIYQVDDSDYRIPDHMVLLDNEADEQILDFSSPYSPLHLNTTTNFGVSLIGWFADSSQFVASGSRDEQNVIAILEAI